MTKNLGRKLGLLDVFCIASGAMISSGIFILPAIAYIEVGPALFISYILASILAIPTLLSKAELVTAMPKAGGDYFYISRAMGHIVGIIAGLSSWFSLSLKGAFALIGMAAYVESVFHTPIKFLAVGICILFILLNLVGIKEAAKWQVVMVLFLFAVLILFIFFGFPNIHIERYVPFIPYGMAPIFATAGLVFISYGGLTKIDSISEEIKNPRRNIPLGMILSLIIVSVIYALAVFVTTGILSSNTISTTLTPLSDAAMKFAGNTGALIVSIAALLAFVTTSNASIMSSSRYPMAMSRDRLLPSIFERTNRRFNTPHYAILLTGFFMITAILFLRLEMLVKIASSLLLLLYICANLSVIIMRESKIQNYRPAFYSPFYPVTQLIGIAGGIFLLFEMGRIVWDAVVIFIACGLVLYLIFAGTRAKREYALIHVVERVINKELTTGDLSRELRNVLRERDNITEDRFDLIIKNAVILDFENELDMEQFFKYASNALSERVNLSEKEIYDLLLSREKESSTVIHPGLAIPHIVIEGRNIFEIVLARCKRGINFAGEKDKVHAVFVLAGSKDERNFHLKALAAIAEIVQQPDFEKRWIGAKNMDGLKDIILLAERKRHITI